MAEVPTEPAALGADESRRRRRVEEKEAVEALLGKVGREAVEMEEGVKLREAGREWAGGWLARRRGEGTEGAAEDKVE